MSKTQRTNRKKRMKKARFKMMKAVASKNNRRPKNCQEAPRGAQQTAQVAPQFSQMPSMTFPNRPKILLNPFSNRPKIDPEAHLELIWDQC